jgi:endoglucanase
MTNKYFGVNLAGGDFGNNIPGIYGQDYIYPVNIFEHQYYASKGLKLFRIPIKWERIQRVLNGSLNGDSTTGDVHSITMILDAAQKVGTQVILELHNEGRYNNIPCTAQNLADVWVKIATQFGKHPALFGYEIMNEPHDLPDGVAGWKTICQTVADAIATIDKKHWIIIPGYDYQSADRWQQNNLDLLITGNNILYGAHCYFDPNASGTYTTGDPTDVNIGVERAQHFIDWLQHHNVQGIFTEYGIPWNNKNWFPVMDNFLNLLNTTDCIIGGTAWAGGPWWGEYNLSIEPTQDFTIDRASMSIYQKYPTTAILPEPTIPPPVNPSVLSVPPFDIALANIVLADAKAVLEWIRKKLNI